ncbi:caspase domain-containing protein [Kitasatospora sp. NPDC059646]|uniref:caspase family protein n=1 Tax=Kitasatospora sp. NPDC059646 TaxID=3346893 RepID=UPI003688FCA9
MSRFPDPVRSRAVLIGVGSFPEEPGLSDLPAVRENVAGLRRRLTDARTGVLDAGSCEVVDPSASVADIGRAVGRAAAEATDLLLVYYAGHGLVDDRGRLHLATSTTRTGAPKYSALAVDLLREDLGASGAAARVLILDCCFSGRAIDVMAGEEGVVDGQLSIAGTYTMTSSSATTPSYAPTGEQYTAFTRALLAALDNAEPLTLDGIYHAVAADLTSRGLPRPRQRATDTAASLSLTRGPLPPTDAPDTEESDRARFHRHPELQARQARNAIRGCLSVIAGLCLPLGGVVAWGAHDVTALWGIPAMGGALMLMVLAIKAVAAPSELKEAELIIDRSAITLHNHYRNRTDTLRLAWEDITAVGVVPPSNLRGRSDLFGPHHLLTVQPKPETPQLSAFDMLFSAKLSKLGYVPLARVGGFATDKDSVLEALDRFAGVPVLHTTQELMNHDPRIREDML